MKIAGLEFAYNDLFEKVHIDVAQKDTRWWLLEHRKIELILCEGDKVKKYWRTKSNEDFLYKYPDGVRQYWNSESEPHKYIKRQLLEKKTLLINNEVLVKAHCAKGEVWIDSIRKRPDVVFYDEAGNIICLIEIYCSNKKSPKDIRKLSELNIPVFEINASNYEVEDKGNNRNRPRVNLIFNPKRGKDSSVLNEEIKQTERGIKENKRIYKPQYRELKEYEEDLEWLEEEIQSGGIKRLVEYGDRIKVVKCEIEAKNREELLIIQEIGRLEVTFEQRMVERHFMLRQKWGQ